jgi:SAM-dependent methyltransferase
MCDWLEQRYVLNGKTVLEVGCAEGWFLEEARNRGMLPCAIEPSFPHAEIARAKGFRVSDGFFPNDLDFNEPFDFIVFNDVFEHLPDPVEALQKCEKLLTPQGVLVLNLPSSRGAIYRMGKLLARMGHAGTLERLWQKDFPSPHLYYFSPSTLLRFTKKYSGLHHVGSTKLETFVTDGLWERIKVSHHGTVGRIIYACLRLSLPVFRLLPADIIVEVFTRTPKITT